MVLGCFFLKTMPWVLVPMGLFFCNPRFHYTGVATLEKAIRRAVTASQLLEAPRHGQGWSLGP
jgi:hypothetical protein